MGKIVSAVGGIAGGILGGIDQQRSQRRAANAQMGAAQRAIDEQAYQFDYIRDLLKPYVEAGTPALEQQKALIGLAGPEAQQAQISQLESSPIFQALLKQQEDALLQNASATGGLRGGNFQAALAQFRPNMLNQQIENQYGRLGDFINLGSGAASGLGGAAMRKGENTANLLLQQGQALANKRLAGGWMGTLGSGLMMAGSNPTIQGLFGGGGAPSGGIGSYYAGLAR